MARKTKPMHKKEVSTVFLITALVIATAFILVASKIPQIAKQISDEVLKAPKKYDVDSGAGGDKRKKIGVMPPPIPLSTQLVINNKNTLVILAYFNNSDKTPSLSNNTIAYILFNQTNDYFIENSYSKIGYTGNVIGWYGIDTSNSSNITEICDLYEKDIFIQAVDPDVNFLDYKQLIIVTPNFCNNGSYSASYGSVSFPTDDINESYVSMPVSIIRENSFTMSIVAKALAQNLGNKNSRFLNCGNNSLLFDVNSNCTYYLTGGDPFDLMGYRLAHLNSFHKDVSAFFNNSNIAVVTGGALNYVLNPIETNSIGLKAIKIQVGNPTYVNSYLLYVEYRQPIGYDSDLDTIKLSGGQTMHSDIFEGALIYYVPTPLKYSYLLDASPQPSGAPENPVLKPGMSFIDPNSGTNITVVSGNPSNITINVTVINDNIGPQILRIYPEDNTVHSSTINVNATALDFSGVSKVEFAIDGMANPPNNKIFATVTSAPQNIYKTSLNTNLVPYGLRNLFITAYDNNGNSNTAVLPITANNTDSINPTIAITFPLEGANMGTSSVIVDASASDNIGIWKVEFIIDNNVNIIDYDAPYSYSDVFTVGPHNVKAKAYDFVGNNILDEVNFNVS